MHEEKVGAFDSFSKMLLGEVITSNEIFFRFFLSRVEVKTYQRPNQGSVFKLWRSISFFRPKGLVLGLAFSIHV